MVGNRFFVEPYLKKILGLREERPLQAKVLTSVKKPKGFRCFLKAKVSAIEGVLRVEAQTAQGSYQVSSLVDSNAWMILRESESDQVEAGEWVDVLPIRSGGDFV